MRLRPYQKRDAAVIAGWSTDERTHALWCANLIPFPAAAEEFHAYARRAEEEYGNNGFTALKDDGTPVGYFRLGINPDTDSGFLGFVIIDGKERGKGCGEQMLRLAVRYAFEIAGLHSVALNVFDCNRAAEGLYRKLGFREAERTPECFAFLKEKWGRIRMELVVADV